MDKIKKMKAVIVGFGNRGQVYGDYSFDEPDQFEVIGVVDPNPFKLEIAKERYHLNDNQLFKSFSDFEKEHINCDFIINTTMDQDHYEVAMQILNAKYNMLMEKPIVPNKEQLLEIKNLAKKNNCLVFVCHVLRYTPFYRTIKKLINEGAIGTIMTMEMNEHVHVSHFLTSYDRGKWGKESECGSGFLLAKCCHDMDLISWLNNASKPIEVSSFANRARFVPSNKPSDATDRCSDCPHEKDGSCLYSAYHQYIEFDPMPFLTWDNLNKPLDQITREEKIENLKITNFGRCAYDCGGDIVDRQNVIINFENGSLATFNLVGGAYYADRYIHIVGSDGEIEGKVETGKFILRKNNYSFHGETIEYDLNKEIHNSVQYGGHSGGDYAIMHDLIMYLNGDRSSVSITSIDDSVNGHLIVYAAEESRKTKKVIKVED